MIIRLHSRTKQGVECRSRTEVGEIENGGKKENWRVWGIWSRIIRHRQFVKTEPNLLVRLNKMDRE